jgi:hypothetical protein
MAVFTLLVIGVLVGTSFALGRQELAAGAGTLRLQEALAAAEGGMQLQVALWDPSGLNALAPGDSVPFSGSFPAGGWYRGATRRLNELLFLVRAEGFSRDSGARQESAMLVRLEPIELRRTAALATQGATEVREGARIDGSDRAPPGWSGCALPQPPVAGIRVPAASHVSTTGCASPPCVAGSPDVWVDSALHGAALSTFGDATFDDLRSRATLVVPGGTRLVVASLIGGVCNAVDPDNWGSPTSPGGPCGNRFPIVWSEGALTLTGGEGQGVLIVNGDLAVGGGFTFYGVVIVRGRITTLGPGGSVHGAVVVANAEGLQQDLAGNTLIQSSACAMNRALLRGALPGPLRSRGWVGLQ